jgi:hypothetical protein
MNHLTYLAISGVCLVLASVCFKMNEPNRAAIDLSLAHVANGPWDVPERIWPHYDFVYLNKFITAAAVQPTSFARTALELYVRPTLLWIDIGFAVFCAGFAAFFWLGLQGVVPDYPLIRYLMTFFITMSLLYGVADVAEDLWLVRLFSKGGDVSRNEGRIAFALTDTKRVTIALSGVGGLLFLVLEATSPKPTTTQKL